MDVKKRILYFLEKKNTNINQVAKSANMNASTINCIITRNSSPTIETMQLICKEGLNVTMSQFFLEDGEEMIAADDEIKEMLGDWILLTKKQKQAVLSHIKSYLDDEHA